MMVLQVGVEKSIGNALGAHAPGLHAVDVPERTCARTHARLHAPRRAAMCGRAVTHAGARRYDGRRDKRTGISGSGATAVGTRAMHATFTRSTRRRGTVIMEVGFCGPGLMGAPMIRHLLRAGHTVHVWNRARDKAEALAKDGAQVASTPGALAGRAELIFLCVSDAAAVEQVVFDAEQGIATAAQRATMTTTGGARVR